MRATGIFGVIMLVVWGVIIADLVLPSHQPGTKAAANGIVNIETPVFKGLLGQTS